jgi:hypothetical protein
MASENKKIILVLNKEKIMAKAKKMSAKGGKGLSAPDPSVSSGQAKMGVRPIKNTKGKNIEKKGASAPKPSVSTGQMKVAKRPIKDTKGKVIG